MAKMFPMDYGDHDAARVTSIALMNINNVLHDILEEFKAIPFDLPEIVAKEKEGGR